MELNPSQTKFIRCDLQKRGLHFLPLQEDLLDHLCCLVEEEMRQGVEFHKAYSSALKKLGPFRLIQAETLDAVEAAGLLSKLNKLLDHFMALVYMSLGLVFFSAPILLAVYHRDLLFLLFFSPFVIAGFWLLATRINYRSLSLITYKRTVFPQSLVH